MPRINLNSVYDVKNESIIVGIIDSIDIENKTANVTDYYNGDTYTNLSFFYHCDPDDISKGASVFKAGEIVFISKSSMKILGGQYLKSCDVAPYLVIVNGFRVSYCIVWDVIHDCMAKVYSIYGWEINFPCMLSFLQENTDLFTNSEQHEVVNAYEVEWRHNIPEIYNYHNYSYDQASRCSLEEWEGKASTWGWSSRCGINFWEAVDHTKSWYRRCAGVPPIKVKQVDTEGRLAYTCHNACTGFGYQLPPYSLYYEKDGIRYQLTVFDPETGGCHFVYHSLEYSEHCNCGHEGTHIRPECWGHGQGWVNFESPLGPGERYYFHRDLEYDNERSMDMEGLRFTSNIALTTAKSTIIDFNQFRFEIYLTYSKDYSRWVYWKDMWTVPSRKDFHREIFATISVVGPYEDIKDCHNYRERHEGFEDALNFLQDYLANNNTLVEQGFTVYALNYKGNLIEEPI